MLRHAPVTLAGLAFTLALIACSVLARHESPAAASAPTDTPAPAASQPAIEPSASTASDTPAAAPTTGAQATIPPFLTSIPGIAATIAAAHATPGLESTLAAQQTIAAGTQAVLAPQISGTFLSQCPHPSDPPMQTWQDIPVMPQATAGQVVQTLVGPYYCFRAPVTAQNLGAFYQGKLSAPQWMLESDVNGTMEFVGISQAGAQFLMITSAPGDQNDLLVAINVSRAMGLPTP